MTSVQETIPEGLRPEVEATLAWFNRGEDVAFEVTGMLPGVAYAMLLGTPFPGEVGIDTSTVLPTPTGLTLWVNLNLFGAPGVADASGNATFPVPLAGVTSLIGASFFAQAFQLDVGLPFAIPYAATRAIKWTIGSF